MSIKRHALVFLCLYALTIVGQIELTGRVVDNAGLLSSSQKTELETMLADYENTSRNQVVVVSVPSLMGKNIEDFGYQLGRQWGIGSKEKNNGVLFIIAPQEREVRLEVGYGLEGILTDAQSKLIIERIILPFFKRGEMDEGILEGTRAIIATLGGQGDALKEAVKDQYDPFEWATLLFIVGIFIFLTILNNRSGRGGPRFPGNRGPFYGSSGHDPRAGSGFSGGGGSFGGGGASGKW